MLSGLVLLPDKEDECKNHNGLLDKVDEGVEPVAIVVLDDDEIPLPIEAEPLLAPVRGRPDISGNNAHP